ncbi:peroxidase 17 isoform X2 [Cryptomeria japonica]|uniref:peroxidase 17 isoform X2 n=1 Tax=Cryptomeria japonica TaxID=3369 RepID=UPI0027DA630E|nr:peroxidase 17 isoform X2 [Cryptomeria japonica]
MKVFQKWVFSPVMSMALQMIAIMFICYIIIISSSGDTESRRHQQQQHLYKGFYRDSCPMAEAVVRSVMEMAIKREPRNAASVLRLQYHDCLVNGCDGSVLLDETPNMAGEKNALSNINSLRAYDVIDEIKDALEKACPGTVSCADILIIAARDAVTLSGGPFWEVYLGRKDSLTASQDDSNDIMPSPRANVTTLVQLFKSFDLSVTDLVALSDILKVHFSCGRGGHDLPLLMNCERTLITLEVELVPQASHPF